ncbi:helix-turn-helix domain-containing transcriptional regulator [Yersinia aldovae]|uniref:helix-turn-helix domain-containing transcriptional regulator n=1 Tax=Yersinia aldovae TaxID=29483 RepID=UPI0005E57956|nr:DNA-binding protein [Yersinia aldovae]CNI30708.1 putative DNA-binding prophage protein [Yersinia aldovae]
MVKARLNGHAMVQLLIEDPEFAQVYLHQALLDIDEEGGQASVAKKAGVSRETLYRTLSPSGNPTLKTLLSVVSATGFQFSHIASITA